MDTRSSYKWLLELYLFDVLLGKVAYHSMLDVKFVIYELFYCVHGGELYA